MKEDIIVYGVPLFLLILIVIAWFFNLEWINPISIVSALIAWGSLYFVHRRYSLDVNPRIGAFIEQLSRFDGDFKVEIRNLSTQVSARDIRLDLSIIWNKQEYLIRSVHAEHHRINSLIPGENVEYHFQPLRWMHENVDSSPLRWIVQEPAIRGRAGAYAPIGITISVLLKWSWKSGAIGQEQTFEDKAEYVIRDEPFSERPKWAEWSMEDQEGAPVPSHL